MKTCTKCGIEKPLEEGFYKDTSRKSGYGSICKECRKSYELDRAKRPDYNREKNLKKQYGITIAEYDALLAEQGGRCKICKTDTPSGRGRFHVDHNHKTGKIRGILCHHCNSGIGKLQDSPEILRAAIRYLEEQGYYG